MEHPYFQQCLADVTGAIPKTWVNESYHNDACPSYSYNGWQIFIDHPDPDMRDVKEMQRFGVVVAENYGNGLGIDTPEFSSDDFQEVLNFVSKPAPKYEQDDSGNYVEVKPKEKTKKRPRHT